MKHILLSKSSAGPPYEVTFELVNGRMTVRCTCKAGQMDQQCKHKRALASGDGEMLFDQSQTKTHGEIIATQEARELAACLKIEEVALGAIEIEKSRLAAEEKSIKRRIGNLFAKGEC